jgi:hypothetical protein
MAGAALAVFIRRGRPVATMSGMITLGMQANGMTRQEREARDRPHRACYRAQQEASKSSAQGAVVERGSIGAGAPASPVRKFSSMAECAEPVAGVVRALSQELI